MFSPLASLLSLGHAPPQTQQLCWHHTLFNLRPATVLYDKQEKALFNSGLHGPTCSSGSLTQRTIWKLGQQGAWDDPLTPPRAGPLPGVERISYSAVSYKYWCQRAREAWLFSCWFSFCTKKGEGNRKWDKWGDHGGTSQ